LRCKYCFYTINNIFLQPQYPTKKIIEFIKIFADKSKIITPTYFAFSGGEPTILKDFDLLIHYLSTVNIHTTLFTNCIKFSPIASSLLENNNIDMTTSIDAGIPSTYYSIHGANAMHKVLDTIIRYRNTGTSGLYIKYNILDSNMDDDNLYAFIFMMAAIQPKLVVISPEFPKDDLEIPFNHILFGAKMWYLISKYTQLQVHIRTDEVLADARCVKYSNEIRNEYKKLCEKSPIDDTYNLNKIKQKELEEYIKILNSNSWRITAPLRQIRYFINRFIKYCNQHMYSIWNSCRSKIKKCGGGG
jgi:hypothetical protein